MWLIRALAFTAGSVAATVAAEPAPAATVTARPASPPQGGSVHLSGSGFAPRALGTVRLGLGARQVRTDGRGRLSVALPVAASAPRGLRRLTVRVGDERVTTSVTVSAQGQDSATLAAHSSGPRLVVVPSQAPAGAPVRLRGSRFDPRALVEVRLGARLLGTVRASRRGGFALTVRVPPSAPGVGRLAVRWSAGEVQTRFAVTPAAGAPVIVGAAGDIACAADEADFNEGLGTRTHCRQGATARRLALAAPAAVLPLGDTQYEDGGLDDYAQSYAPSWGRFDLIAHPVVGNREYGTPGAAGYFAYFGASAGRPGAGWYSFDLGAWHLIALNSECREVACEAGSAQEAWLRADLAAHPNRCTLASWHRPRFTSGGSQAAATDAFWRDLYAAGAEVVLGGHRHQYERFTPQTPDREPDPATGIRQFVVGTGGDDFAPFEPDARPNSEVRIPDTFGVLLLTLRPDGYAWRFVSESGAILDTGEGACH
jgi:acid phosphatase type 7